MYQKCRLIFFHLCHIQLKTIFPKLIQVFLQVFQDGVQTEDKAEAEQESVTSELIDLENADQEEDQADESDEILETKPRVVPPPGSGQRIYEIDPMLEGHRAHLDYR